MGKSPAEQVSSEAKTHSDQTPQTENAKEAIPKIDKLSESQELKPFRESLRGEERIKEVV